MNKVYVEHEIYMARDGVFRVLRRTTTSDDLFEVFFPSHWTYADISDWCQLHFIAP